MVIYTLQNYIIPSSVNVYLFSGKLLELLEPCLNILPNPKWNQEVKVFNSIAGKVFRRLFGQHTQGQSEASIATFKRANWLLFVPV